MIHIDVIDTSPSHFHFLPAKNSTDNLCIGFVCKGITQRICFDYNNTDESDPICYCISSSLVISMFKIKAVRKASFLS